MECITNISFSEIVHGILGEPYMLETGIKQKDPISP